MKSGVIFTVLSNASVHIVTIRISTYFTISHNYATGFLNFYKVFSFTEYTLLSTGFQTHHFKTTTINIDET